jgi:putative acetyltransferase
MKDATLSISVEAPDAAESLSLQAAMWAELGALYGKDTGPMKWSPDELAGPGSAFVVAWHDGEAVGCGAVIPAGPGEGEIRRMYVAPPARGRGVARRMLEALEGLALGLGYERVKLETGVRQPEALAFYRSAGFREIPCWGRHARDPESVCLAKALGPDADPEAAAR